MKDKFISLNSVADVFEQLKEMRIVSYVQLVEAIAAIPAADVREMKNGKWRLIGADRRCRGGIFLCSVCDKTCPYKTPFCPNCGADMREELPAIHGTFAATAKEEALRMIGFEEEQT